MGRGHLTRILALSERMREIGKSEEASLPEAGGFEPVFWCPEKYHREIRLAFPEASIFSIPYYKIVLDGNRIDVLRTGISNAEHIPEIRGYSSEIADQLRLARVTSLVSDFEPFAARAARIAGIPIVQLNHPGVVLKSPSLLPDALIAKAVALGMMGEYDQRIISSFYHGDVGPIIRKELRDILPKRGSYYVVYLKDDMRDQVLDYLESHSPLPYYLFPHSERDFVDYLAGSGGVITNSGHQLISEALHLGKPCFTLPLEGQYEQRLNARMLEATGRGISASPAKLSSRLVEFFRLSERYLSHHPFGTTTQSEENKEEEREDVAQPADFILHDDSKRAARLVFRFASRNRAVS